jgi:hypothetical protein
VLFEGANAGFQRVAGSPGALSNVIPYVVAGTGSVVAFSGSINVNNLSAGAYIFQICSNVANNASAPAVGNILVTVTLTTTAAITGTIVFSSLRTDVGAQAVFEFNPAKAAAPATVSWTSNIAGSPITRNDAISLYSNPNITQSAIYSVFMSTNS